MSDATATRISSICAAALLLTGSALAQEAEQCSERYVVQEGDSLHVISQRCDVALAQIIERNPGLGVPPEIAPGTELDLGTPAPRQAPPAAWTPTRSR